MMNKAPKHKLIELIKNKGYYDTNTVTCQMSNEYCLNCEANAINGEGKYKKALAAFIREYGEEELFEIFL